MSRGLVCPHSAQRMLSRYTHLAADGGSHDVAAQEQRLRATFQFFHLLQQEDSSHVVRAWLIGMNPQLEMEAPANMLHDGRLREVLLAADAYLGGG